jgi:hypothetical protein
VFVGLRASRSFQKQKRSAATTMGMVLFSAALLFIPAAVPAPALPSFQRITRVCSTCAAPASGGGLRVNASTAAAGSGRLLSASSAENCASACLAYGGCISFNFAGSECELNRFAETYTVVTTSSPSEYWLRREQPGAQAAAAPATAVIASQLVTPTGNVTLARGGRLDSSMEISVDYLLRNYEVDNMLWWFRWRAQNMRGSIPPGHAQVQMCRPWN